MSDSQRYHYQSIDVENIVVFQAIVVSEAEMPKSSYIKTNLKVSLDLNIYCGHLISAFSALLRVN